MLDSSAVIAAERAKESVTSFFDRVVAAHGPLKLCLPPITVAEFVHGIYRARTAAESQRRRQFTDQLVTLLPVYPVTFQAAKLAGQIDGQGQP
jgi:predicted nucleic acid-binding protein